MLKKYSCYGLKKFIQGIWQRKKILENSPPPNNFSNGPSLIYAQFYVSLDKALTFSLNSTRLMGTPINLNTCFLTN